MHPIVAYQLAKSHIANLNNQAEHETRVRAARRIRRSQGQRGSHLARWLLAVLIGRVPARLRAAHEPSYRRDMRAVADSETTG